MTTICHKKSDGRKSNTSEKKTLENKFTYTFSLIKNNPRALKDDFSSRTDPYPFESIMQID